MFARPSPDQQRARRQAEKAANLSALATPSRTLHRAAIARFDVAAKPIEKEQPARSEAYRRLVAAMPCCLCGRQGPNQAAHANAGKGMAMKSDDRSCFSLCPSDHRIFDQGGMDRERRRDLEQQFGAHTRAWIKGSGQWPKDLADWPGKQLEGQT